jgi:hypothetical protein
VTDVGYLHKKRRSFRERSNGGTATKSELYNINKPSKLQISKLQPLGTYL